MGEVLRGYGDVDPVSASALGESDEQRSQRIAARPAGRGLRGARLRKAELARGIPDLQEADPVHPAFIAELQFVASLDLVQTDIQVVRVQRVVQDGKGLR